MKTPNSDGTYSEALSEEQKRQIDALYANGFNTRAISTRLGLTYEYVQGYILENHTKVLR